MCNFGKLNSIEKTAYVLESELWECNFDQLLSFLLYMSGRQFFVSCMFSF